MASRGILWICTMAATGLILMHTGSVIGDTDPCTNHEEIKEDERDISSIGLSRCDKDLRPGWYRFFIDGASAIIPTECIKPGGCGTSLGMWADLKGQSMPVEGQTIHAQACASYSILDHWSCCALQQKIKIRHCTGNFYIYHLNPTDRCPVSYCAVRNETKVELASKVRHGFHVSYVETTTVTEATTQQIETTEIDVTTVQYQDDATTMNYDGLQQAQENDQNETLIIARQEQEIDMTTVVSEQDVLQGIISSGDGDFVPPTTEASLKTTPVEKQEATSAHPVVVPTTSTKTHWGRPYAELTFPLNGHDKQEVLASFRANFTSAMQIANRHIHNITVEELCTIGDHVRIRFRAFDNKGKLIPGFKVQEDMEMRKKVEEALGLRPHPKRQDIFQEYLALFIILIIIGFLCLIILLSSCMYLYCRRHSGHWDRALAEQMGLFDVRLLSFSTLQYHVTVVPRREARIAESPYSDEAIMSDEILEKQHSSLGSHYPGVGNLHDLSYPNSLSGIKAMNNKNSFNTYPNSYGSLPKDGIEGLVVPIDQLKPEKDALIIEDTVL